jgi:predicted lactoylglutathione lyase
MASIIFPNLAVSDLEKATGFYTALGFTVNPQFTDENASAIVVSEQIILMLLSPGFAKESGLAAPSGEPSVSLALTVGGPAEVDAIIERALAAGAQLRGETTDLGFMYSRGISDPDGHYLDFLWMDPEAVESY